MAALQVEGTDLTIRGHVINVSRGGALVRTSHALLSAARYLVTFLPGDDGVALEQHECPRCGHQYDEHRLWRTTVWARVRRQGRGGGGGWAAAMEFETLIDLHPRTTFTEVAHERKR
jgi:hypothetical protein